MVTQPNPTPYPNPTNPPTPGAAGEVSRRALFATAGLGVCAAAVVGTPLAIKAAEQYAADQAAKALQDGINEGKQAVLAELEELGDISIDTAINVAELTRLGVKVIVQPLASLVATIGGDAIGALKSAVDGVRGFAGNFGYHNDQLDQLSTLLGTWHDGLTQLPKALATYANTDITSAETYLKSLKAMIDANKADVSSTPTATP